MANQIEVKEEECDWQKQCLQNQQREKQEVVEKKNLKRSNQELNEEKEKNHDRHQCKNQMRSVKKMR